ncbi:hypothetical protein PybrP1_008945 [[Pythium] brassicae (nom. inval.)]|nr:hypothetical protein PybrP1_008945 [[Pythium] brassicae (nom. inval.)]
MKTLQLLSAATAAFVLLDGVSVSAASAPRTPSHVPLNGWYKCSASTLSPGEKAPHSDDYYMETKALRQQQPHGKHHGLHAPVLHADEPKLRAPSVLVGEQRRQMLPFLQRQQSFEWLARNQRHVSEYHREQEATEHHHHHHHRSSSGGGGSTHDRSWAGRDSALSRPQYECGAFRVPMCYEGICNSTRTIDVFVKRVAATAPATKKQKALWVLQGGPGASSTAMEGLMDSLYRELDGHVSIYTMDHRGTGRSHRLICDAAQAGTVGSPSGASIGVDEVPACIQDVRFQIDNQTAAFSVTSAAMDLKSVIESHLADQDVFVYGLSYGTYLVERLVHFAPAVVKGFSVDGIVSEFGADADARATYSNWDRDVGVVADRFLAHCLKDALCGALFPGVHDLGAFTRALYEQLDAAARTPGTNACADALARSGATRRRPSYLLRTTFGEYLADDVWRTVIPAVIHRAARCSKQDAAALRVFASAWDGAEDSDDGDGGVTESDMDRVLYMSEMLYNVIVFSEMWESPSPDKATLVRWYENATMASDNYYVLPYYCLFTGSTEKACAELTHLPPSLPFAYTRDQYWNVPATLPARVPMLLLVGGLDVQTRRAYGANEYKDVTGDKMLVDFEFASHCTTFSTPTKSGRGSCGMLVLASFVRENGALAKVDTSCVGDTYALSFRDSVVKAEELFGQSSLYG